MVFGYVKECEKKNKRIIPDMIAYLCLMYLNQGKDKFEPKNIRQHIKIDGDCIKCDEAATSHIAGGWNKHDFGVFGRD